MKKVRLKCNKDKQILGVRYKKGDVAITRGPLRRLLIKEGFTEIVKPSKKKPGQEEG
jgi:hypothetical protein